jgi:hypothetical protein
MWGDASVSPSPRGAEIKAPAAEHAEHGAAASIAVAATASSQLSRLSAEASASGVGRVLDHARVLMSSSILVLLQVSEGMGASKSMHLPISRETGCFWV